jgi:hypothetical protein
VRQASQPYFRRKLQVEDPALGIVPSISKATNTQLLSTRCWAVVQSRYDYSPKQDHITSSLSQFKRMDAAFKYILAIVYIDSRCSWSKGPRKVFTHLCLPILSQIHLPDFKNLHPRQILEQLMRQRNCGALEVKKSAPDSLAKVEGKCPDMAAMRGAPLTSLLSLLANSRMA